MAGAMANPDFRAKVAQAEKRSAKLILAPADGVKTRRSRRRAGKRPDDRLAGGSFVAPAARMSRAFQAGMSDVKSHVISWLLGYIYVGNGTLGATDAVYMVDPTVTYTVTPSGYTGIPGAPVYESDSVFGASYALDVVKHYSRIRRRRMRVKVKSIQPATSNSMQVLIAASRGPSYIGSTATDTTAGASYTNVVSMRDVKDAPCWGDTELDLTPFIAGGNGPQQNEFDTAIGDDTKTETGAPAYSTRGVVPCCLIVSGKNSTTGLRGTTTHAVFVEELVDLIDWTGGTGVANPVPRVRGGPEEKHLPLSDGGWQHVTSAGSAGAKLVPPPLRRTEPDSQPDNRAESDSARARSLPPGNRGKPAVS